MKPRGMVGEDWNKQVPSKRIPCLARAHFAFSGFHSFASR